MITFDPESPWEKGDVVNFYQDGKLVTRKVVIGIEKPLPDDGSDCTDYHFEDPPSDLLPHMLQWPEVFV
jgi:hypothetical protein